MLKTLYDHFVILYKPIAPKNPALASEHALRQEEEVYKKSNKLSYRNVGLYQDFNCSDRDAIFPGRHKLCCCIEATTITRFGFSYFRWHGR